ncbi:hypothetical protein GOP47_0004686 [Adiantum capillus-veneris]|uniref:Syntaxin N-terminal domain-containing protein n=1 Tax=Adiantum capillus-veneris TaxID=13818 RepID=A0A9D4ZMV5_ADICA|nr:hypothetical protein GOP47_0004686 [Adiantum capillus-veneris]
MSLGRISLLCSRHQHEHVVCNRSCSPSPADTCIIAAMLLTSCFTIMNNLHEPLLSPSPSSSSSSAPAIHSHSQNSYSLNTQLVNDNLSSFFEKVDSISFSTEARRQAFHVVEQEQSKQSPKNSIALSSKMQADMDSILSQARSINLSLDSLNKDNMNNRTLPGCHENSSVDRVRGLCNQWFEAQVEGLHG